MWWSARGSAVLAVEMMARLARASVVESHNRTHAIPGPDWIDKPAEQLVEETDSKLAAQIHAGLIRLDVATPGPKNAPEVGCIVVNTCASPTSGRESIARPK